MDAKTDHVVGKKEIRFMRLLLIFTVRDVLELTDWYFRDQIADGALWRLDIPKNANKEKYYHCISESLGQWICSEHFERICESLHLDHHKVCKVLENTFNGKDCDRLRDLLQQYKEELALYAFHGPQKEQTGTGTELAGRSKVS